MRNLLFLFIIPLFGFGQQNLHPSDFKISCSCELKKTNLSNTENDYLKKTMQDVTGYKCIEKPYLLPKSNNILINSEIRVNIYTFREPLRVLEQKALINMMVDLYNNGNYPDRFVEQKTFNNQPAMTELLIQEVANGLRVEIKETIFSTVNSAGVAKQQLTIAIDSTISGAINSEDEFMHCISVLSLELSDLINSLAD